MKTLIKYEFLKILRRKSTLVVMAASLLVTAFLFGLPALQFQTYSAQGVVKGREGVACEKEQYARVSVPLTEEYVTQTIGEVQRLFGSPENIGTDGNEEFLVGEAYWEGVAPREQLLNLIANSYAGPDERFGYNKLPELDTAGGAGFYEARNEKIERLLAAPSRGLSEEQKAYWRGKNSGVKTPLRYGYYQGWEVIISSLELLMFALLAVCIAIAPVFSGEYQAGTDAVLLSGRYGKTKLVTAKTAASLLFGALAFTLHAAVAWGLPLAAFGVDGWDLPLQIANTAIPYPLTFLQCACVSLGVVYLVLAAMIGLTLLLSARMKSPYLVLTVLVPVLFVPMFLSPNGATGVYNLTLFLLPYRSFMPEIGTYVSYQFGGLVLDAFAVRGMLYAALAAVTLPLAGLGFCRHQVS